MCAKDDDGVGSAYGELFKFPECGDTLFQLQLQPIDEGIILDDYIDGYKLAVDLLLERVSRPEAEAFLNRVRFPLLFLYRHHIELLLKSVIKHGSWIDGGNPPPSTHCLGDLWKTGRAAVEKHWPGVECDALDATESCVQELAKFDPNGTTFRYPTDKKGKPMLKDVDLSAYDLAHFRETADRVSRFLGRCKGVLYEIAADTWEPGEEFDI